MSESKQPRPEYLIHLPPAPKPHHGVRHLVVPFGQWLAEKQFEQLPDYQRAAVLDRWRPRPDPAPVRADLPFHVRKPEVELLLAAVYRLLNEAEAAEGDALSLNRASIEIHAALLAYERSGHWRHWKPDQPLPAVGALKSNLHRILVLSKPRSGEATLAPSGRSIRRCLTDLKAVGQL